MISDNSYINIKAINVDGTLVPLWEFEYSINEEYGTEKFRHAVNGTRFSAHDIIDCKLDMRTKKVVRHTTIEIDQAPKYVVGEKVMRETSHHVLVPCVVKEIVRGRLEIDRVTAVEDIKSYVKHGGVANVDVNTLDSKIAYNLMVYDPAYVMEDGKVCQWEHELYGIKEV